MAWDNAFCQQMLELALSEEDFEEFNLERSIKQSKVVSDCLIHINQHTL